MTLLAGGRLADGSPADVRVDTFRASGAGGHDLIQKLGLTG